MERTGEAEKDGKANIEFRPFCPVRASLFVLSLDCLVVFQNVFQKPDIASDVAGQYNHALAERTRKNERLFFPFGCLLPGELLPFAGICRNEVAGRR